MSEMHIKRLIRINILLWGTLVISLVVFILRPRNAGNRNGVGGAINPQEFVQPVQDEEEADLELEGIPEPEEFSRPRMLTFSSYTLEKGDMIGKIAIRTGLSEDSLISVNDIKNTRVLQIGQMIKIPNQDGIYYSVKTDDTLESIAEKYNTTAAHIKTANELFSDAVPAKTSLFIPGAKLDWTSKQEINGDLFIWPASGRISSPYGYRLAPFARVRAFHSGVDIAAPMGSSIKAAMAGRVTQVGNDESWGNFVVVSHHSGYRTFYAHMSAVRTKVGAYVETGERIGDVGSTGLSTGPHVHFTVYKNGVTVNPLSLMRN
jgi:murein DD-endopeptidase MepM/ murein hydrolase activator NlpD